MLSAKIPLSLPLDALDPSSTTTSSDDDVDIPFRHQALTPRTHTHGLNLQPDLPSFRLLDLPYELRAKIFHFVLTGFHNFFLDREVAVFGETFDERAAYYGRRGRVKWRGATGAYIDLLCTSRQVRYEVELMLFRQFAFYSSGWGYLMKYSDPSKWANRLPKHKIRHLAYTPHKCRNFREHRLSVDSLLAGLPMLTDVRVMVNVLAVRTLAFGGSTMAGTEHIVAVARLFRSVGKVAVVGQALNSPEDRVMVKEAREQLRESGAPWYWELGLNYSLVLPAASAEML